MVYEKIHSLIAIRGPYWTAIVGLVLFTFSATGIAGEPKPYGKLNADFRSFYFVRDKEDLPTSEALTQGLMLRYDSAYWSEIVGLNASFFGNLKIVGEDGEGGTDFCRLMQMAVRSPMENLRKYSLNSNYLCRAIWISGAWRCLLLC